MKLNDFTHLGVAHDGAIASKGLLDDLENLLLVELLGESLNSGQGLASIALCGVAVVSAYPAFFQCNQAGAYCQGGERIGKREVDVRWIRMWM